MAPRIPEHGEFFRLEPLEAVKIRRHRLMIRASLTSHAEQRLAERTHLLPSAFFGLLDRNLTVSVGVEPYTRRRHRLFYSELDKAHFVAIQDFETGEVITILPIDYHENLAWKISNKSLRRAVWLQNPHLHHTLYAPAPASSSRSKCEVMGIFFGDDMRSRKHNLGSHRFEEMPKTAEEALSDESFVDKLLAKIKQKGLELACLEEIILYQKRSGVVCKIPWTTIDGFILDVDLTEPVVAPNGGSRERGGNP